MWPAGVLTAVLIALASRRTRWADITGRVLYGAYLLVALLYIPARAGFHLTPPDCEWTFHLQAAVYSLGNYQHIILMACFFLMTYTQLRKVPRAMMWAFLACVALGFLAEIEEGAARFHHCRMRDMIPDTAGAAIGLGILLVFAKLTARRQ